MSEQLAPTKTTSRFQDFDLRAVAPFAALAVLMVLGYFVNARFIDLDNITNVLARSAFIATIAVGVTSVVTTIIGIVLLGFVGRRTMLLIGFAGVAGARKLNASV